MADTVFVSSGPYTFSFDKHQPLGMIAPIWTRGGTSTPNWTTFQLELATTTRHDKLVSRLRDIHPSLLLFLRQLVCIELELEGRTTRLVKSLSDGVTNVTRTDSAGQTTSNSYLLFEHSFTPYSGEEKRQGITKSKIVLAFPVAGDGGPIDREQQVHAFLPLRSYGFRVR